MPYFCVLNIVDAVNYVYLILGVRLVFINMHDPCILKFGY